jgi:hypothetical protein
MMSDGTMDGNGVLVNQLQVQSFSQVCLGNTVSSTVSIFLSLSCDSIFRFAFLDRLIDALIVRVMARINRSWRHCRERAGDAGMAAS